MPLQSTSILSRTFTTSPGTCLQLRGNEFTQPIAIAQRWTRLRIGIFASLTTEAANTNSIYNASLAMGFCTTGRPYTSDTANFFGWFSGSTGAGGTATYAANSGNPYFSGTTFAGGSKINQTLLTAGAGSATWMLPTTLGSSLNRRGILFADITKGSPNYSVTAYSTVAAHMALDLTLQDFYNGMEQVATTPSVAGSALNASTAQATAFSETLSTLLTSVNIYWNRWRFPLEIYALAVYQVS